MSECEALHQRLFADLETRFPSPNQVFSFDDWRRHTKTAGAVLKLDQQQTVVDLAIETLQTLYVHMELKRTRHGVDPVRRLMLFREQLGNDNGDPRLFHNRMLEIFKTLGDVHTAYRLPDPWKHAIAFLPFILGSFVEDTVRRYVVTRTLWDDRDWGLAGFGRGTEVISWNGTPIDEAVRRSAESEEGSTAPHDLALGLQFMTVRWLGASFAPDSPWVIVGYRREGQTQVEECRFFWSVLEGPSTLVVTNQAVPKVFPLAADRPARVSLEMRRQERSRSAHTASDVVHRGRRMLFVGAAAQSASPEMEKLGAELALEFAHPAGRRELHAFTERHKELRPAEGEFPSLSPSFLEAREHDGRRLLDYQQTLNGEWSASVTQELRDAIASRAFGYLGIRGFPLEGRARRIFKYELRRLLSLMPEGGLIVDVRDNPGGSAELAEQSLQFFTAKPIAPLPFRFIASSGTRKLTEARNEFQQYRASIESALSTGGAFSAGVPISTAAEANALGQCYFGPVVLVTNGVTYSAGDLFAAGFEDNNVGPVIGVDETTGGGGANCWFYEENIRRALGMPQLPEEINLQIAVRQCARIGTNNLGVPIEEIGVTTPKPNRHPLTRADILGHSRRPWSLLLRCAAELAKMKSYDLQAQFSIVKTPGGDKQRHVTVTTNGIERLDFYVNGRPSVADVTTVGNAKRPETSFPLPIRENRRLDLTILGYAPGDELVARCVRVFQE